MRIINGDDNHNLFLVYDHGKHLSTQVNKQSFLAVYKTPLK